MATVTRSYRPCPNPYCRCQTPAVQCLAGECWYVICPDCGMQGPESTERPELAITAWNCLPQPMAVDCSSCHRELHPGDRRLPTSHGICRACTERLYGREMAAEVFAKQENKQAEVAP